MILFIAPYAPLNSSNPNLGASRKIEFFLKILSRIDKKIVLVNSSHDATKNAPARIDAISINGLVATQITPSTSHNRQIGKLKNIIDLQPTLDLIHSQGRPTLIWCYNGYAFEARLGGILKKKYDCLLCFEMEDWHFARKRKLMLKPIIDYFAWRASIRLADSAISVSASMTKHIAKHAGPVKNTLELPGVVDDKVIVAGMSRQPFSNAGSITVGYFGGLTTEKGAGILLALIKARLAGVKLVICGSGECLQELKSANNNAGSIASIYTAQPYDVVLNLMASCDVLLNPHQSTSEFLNGVFPSKVIEGLGLGRLYISTKLPELCDSQALRAVLYYDGSIEALVDLLSNADTHFRSRRNEIKAAQEYVRDHYSETGLGPRILKMTDYCSD
jgi:glycosyltransferase involved in cell wall biosynthesis